MKNFEDIRNRSGQESKHTPVRAVRSVGMFLLFLLLLLMMISGPAMHTILVQLSCLVGMHLSRDRQLQTVADGILLSESAPMSEWSCKRDMAVV